MQSKLNLNRFFRLVAGESLLLVLILFAFDLPLSQAQGNSPWSEPVDLSSPMNGAWFPDIAVDSQGGVHVVFLGSTFNSLKDTPLWDKYDYLFYSYISPDGILSNPIPANIGIAPFGAVMRSSLTVDNPRGLLHMNTRVNVSLFYTQVPIDKAALPGAWSEYRNIDDNGTSYYSDIAIDKKGVIHSAWSQVEGDKLENLRSMILYRQSTDSGKTWSFPKIVAVPKYGVTRVVLKIDPDDNLHLSWDDGYDNQTGKFLATLGAYSRSTDGGKTWSEPLIFGSENDPIAQTTLTTFGTNGIMLAWRVLNKQLIDYIVSNNLGQTWSEPASVPGIVAEKFGAQHFFDRYYLAADGKGRVHLAATGMSPDNKSGLIEKPEDVALFHSVWDNGKWSEPEKVGPTLGFPEYPRIGIGPDRINFVWFTRDKPVDETYKAVWYSSRSYDTGITSQPFTIYKAPQPTSTPVVFVQPSPAPQTILPPVEQAAPVEWIDEGYTGMILALLPVMAIAIIMIMRFWWIKRRNR